MLIDFYVLSFVPKNKIESHIMVKKSACQIFLENMPFDEFYKLDLRIDRCS